MERTRGNVGTWQVARASLGGQYPAPNSAETFTPNISESDKFGWRSIKKWLYFPGLWWLITDFIRHQDTGKSAPFKGLAEPTSGATSAR